MERTEHYQLCLWEKDDPVLRTDFNENNEKLDKALTGLPKIVHGTYTGKGGYGKEYPCTIEFPFKPLLVSVFDPNGSAFDLGGNVWPWGAPSGITVTYNSTHYMMYLSWTDNSVTWYGNGGNASTQLNTEGREYHYIAIGITE